jgi:hypothetical protein
VTAPERAFQFPKSEQDSELSELRRTVDRERYSGNQIEGPVLKRQLAGTIKRARRGSIISPSPNRRMTSLWLSSGPRRRPS